MKSDNEKNAVRDITKEESFFAVYCIEALSDALGVPGEDVFDMLTKRSDILDNYIIKYFDTLHTQGEAYIVRELTDVLRKRGVEI